MIRTVDHQQSVTVVVSIACINIRQRHSDRNFTKIARSSCNAFNRKIAQFCREANHQLSKGRSTLPRTKPARCWCLCLAAFFQSRCTFSSSSFRFHYWRQKQYYKKVAMKYRMIDSDEWNKSIAAFYAHIISFLCIQSPGSSTAFSRYHDLCWNTHEHAHFKIHEKTCLNQISWVAVQYHIISYIKHITKLQSPNKNSARCPMRYSTLWQFRKFLDTIINVWKVRVKWCT